LAFFGLDKVAQLMAKEPLEAHWILRSTIQKLPGAKAKSKGRKRKPIPLNNISFPKGPPPPPLVPTASSITNSLSHISLFPAVPYAYVPPNYIQQPTVTISAAGNVASNANYSPHLASIPPHPF
jgi:hypothetical protein